MRLLLDTNIVLWAVAMVDRLPKAVQTLIDDPDNDALFSVVSIWEVVIKNARPRRDFPADACRLRAALLENDYREIPVTHEHVLAVAHLPPIHKDPFDRILLAQAEIEGATLLTADTTLASYPGRIRLVA